MLLSDDREMFQDGGKALVDMTDDEFQAYQDAENEKYYAEIKEGKHDKALRAELRNELKKGNKKGYDTFEKLHKNVVDGNKTTKVVFDRVQKIMKEEQDRDIRLLNSDEQNFLRQMEIFLDDPADRKQNYKGGKMNMLDDDRKKYNMGSRENPVDNRKKIAKGLMGMGISQEEITILKSKPLDSKEVRAIINRTETDYEVEPGVFFDAIVSLRPNKKEDRTPRAEGGSLLDDDSNSMMEPDDNMEEGYLNYILGEALSEEEEDMLMSKLEQDDEMSMLFDKVIDMAQEFAGSGPVEGPGTGVSDSIPARLSDGEFVFTAKAVEEIGEDVLMSMMKEAEDAAEEREGFNIGGTNMQKEKELLDEESNVSSDMRTVNPRLNPNTR